jgi:dephospho-CoA kinase
MPSEKLKTTMKDKKVIGLTGPYCSGKNLVASLLEKRSFPVLDVDKLGHQVIESEKDALLHRFGDCILGPDGRIDRKLLGEKVFGKPNELAALEEIIHPGINQLTLDWINAREEKICFINAALLHRSSAFELLDAVILVKAPLIIRLLRARKRDQLSWVSLFKRFRSQTKFFGTSFRTQLFMGKTDIYRVSNLLGCSNSGYSDFLKICLRNKLERRIDEIISLEELTRV